MAEEKKDDDGASPFGRFGRGKFKKGAFGLKAAAALTEKMVDSSVSMTKKGLDSSVSYTKKGIEGSVSLTTKAAKATIERRATTDAGLAATHVPTSQQQAAGGDVDVLPPKLDLSLEFSDYDDGSED